MYIHVPGYVSDGLSALDAQFSAHVERRVDTFHPRVSSIPAPDAATAAFVLRAPCRCAGRVHPKDEGCPPCFHHFASSTLVWWTKSPERSSWMSEPLTRGEWGAIYDDCARSIQQMPIGYRVLITGSRDWAKELFRGSRLQDGWDSRASAQRDVMVTALREARARADGRALTIVHGAARGADTLAAALAERNGARTEAWPALWRPDLARVIDPAFDGIGYRRALALEVAAMPYSPGESEKRAGMQRNHAMIASGVDECLGFLAAGSGNVGTKACISAARRAGIATYDVTA